MIDNDLIIVPVIFGLPTIVILVRMLIGYRLKMADRRGLSPAAAASIDARLERLEQAMDTLAVELERLGEGQRFTTKLLAERGAAGGTGAASGAGGESVRAPQRSITPH
ncbi:MAG TPA: hypothetical protein VJU87_09875 [Gemmatimonadaceae bacterium]|nr:hypothetical protein [Gemmatimonadaceae bacterium]